MAIEHVQSFGTIPYTRSNDEISFLLIHMYGSAGGTHWTFPKGRPEPWESPTETARRETKEEVGLEVEALDEAHPFVQSYSFSIGETLIKKTVTFYLAEVSVINLSLQEAEVKEARWCSPAEALELLTHHDTKRLLRSVVAYLQG